MPTARAFWAVVLSLAISGCSGGGAPPPNGAEPETSVDALPSATPAASGPAHEQSPLPACSAPHEAGDFVESLTTVDGERSFRVHIPPGYGSAGPVPLVLNFHGSNQSGLHQELYSGLVPIADRAGFVLVSPDAAGYGEWDIVGFYADIGIDDIGFTAALLDHLDAELCIDRARVYATGMSNGAEMASQVGCYLPDRFAAIAPVAGVTYQGCDGGPVAVISFHGSDDYNVPFEETPPAMEAWAAHNGCAGDFDSETVTEHVSRETYKGCGHADVVLYVVDGGGHTWPGADPDAGGVGFTTNEIDASELIWQFFSAHRHE